MSNIGLDPPCPAIRRGLFVCVVLLAISGAVAGTAAGQIAQTDDRQNVIRGTVLNSVTREPIVRALVSSPDEKFAMLTDGEGHFEFALPNSGAPGASSSSQLQVRGPHDRTGASMWLTARKPGFLNRPNESGQAQGVPGSDVTIFLTPEALIKGRVTLSTNDAALGIPVQILLRQVQGGMPRWTAGTETRTNSNGEFRFAELSPGVYKLLTHETMDRDPTGAPEGGQQYGFAPLYYPGVADAAAAGTLQVTAGQTVEADFALARQPYYPVSIPVLNAEQAGLSVTVSVQGHRGPGYSLGYRADKQRIEGLLPNGNYLVEASTTGLNAATGAVNLAVAGAAAEGPGMALTRNGSIRLQVKEEFSDTSWKGSASWNDGNHSFTFYGPRSYLRVQAEASDDFAAQRGASIRPPTGPGDESLVLENLTPGSYWLLLNSSRGYVAAATAGGVDLLHQPITIGPGSIVSVDVVMRDDGAGIEGTVTGVAAGPLAQPGSSIQTAIVYCVPLPDGPGQFQQLSVTADGKFSSQRLAPGSYRVMAFKSAQSNLPYRDPEAMRAYDSAGQIITLTAGQKTKVQLQIASND